MAGRIVVITGTAGGQGRSAALAFAAAGDIVLGCDIKEAEATETVELARAAGGEMHSLCLDPSDPEQAAALSDFARERWGRVDVLYNNAGSCRTRGPFEDTPFQDWQDTLRYELTIVYTTTHAMWSLLKASGRGVIISTASMCGHQEIMPYRSSAHGATKAGVQALTRMFAAEGAEHGIRAVSISPGIIRTPATEKFWTGTPHEQTIGVGLSAKVPLDRPGTAEDISKVAYFLASSEAAYINATDIVVDGGLLGVSWLAGQPKA